MKRARAERRGTPPSRRRTEKAVPAVTAPAPAEAPPRRWFWLQALAVVVITMAAHSSSLSNQYALDDELIILRNIPVQQGVRGIGEILNSHIFQSYFETVGSEALAANKHYRPLTVITFAVEQSLFGRTLGDDYRALITEWNRAGAADPALGERREALERQIDEANREIAFHRHLVQLLLYAGSMVVLLLFLRKCVFPASPAAAFITTVLFALHPIHTEVVANIKSRDEILSLLFILLAGIFVFEYDRARRAGAMLAAMVALMLALLTKEYALVAPAIFAAALILVRGRRLRAAIGTVLPLIVPIVLFLIVRQSFVGGAKPDLATQDILIDPFLKLRTGEMEGSILATKIDIIDHYLRLLLVPYPLSSDYSYATFAYQSFASPAFWLSLLLHAALIALTVFAWRRRHILALAGIWYLGFLVLVQLGATMGERLIYHSSLGFALLLGWGMARLPRPIAALACVALAVPYAFLSFARDAVWKDNRTLFLTDVQTVPRSALVNGNAGAQIMNEALDRIRERKQANLPLTPEDRAFIRQRAADALVYLRRAVTIHERYLAAWINVGIAHYYREEWEPAGNAFARAAAISPTHPALRQYATNFHMLGATLGRSGDLPGAVTMFRRAAEASPREIRFQLDYATALFMAQRYGEAKAAFARARELDPNDPRAAQGLAAADARLRGLQ